VTIREADEPALEVAAYEPVEAFAPTADHLAVYAGTFHSDDAEATLRVAVETDALVVHRRPDTRITLTPVYEDVFRSGMGLVRFHRDGSGTVTGIGLRQARVHDIRFQRIGDAIPGVPAAPATGEVR
jgi:hypothetical protein